MAYPTIILNSNLELIAYFDYDSNMLAGRAQILKQGYGKNKLLLASYSDKAFLLELNKRLIVLPPIIQRFLSFHFLSGILLGIVSTYLVLLKKNRRSNQLPQLSMLDSIDIGLLCLDHQGRIMLINKWVKEFVGTNGIELNNLLYQNI